MSIYHRNTDHRTYHWITNTLAYSYASPCEGTVDMSNGCRVERTLYFLDSGSQECAYCGKEDGEDHQVNDLRTKTGRRGGLGFTWIYRDSKLPGPMHPGL